MQSHIYERVPLTETFRKSPAPLCSQGGRYYEYGDGGGHAIIILWYSYIWDIQEWDSISFWFELKYHVDASVISENSNSQALHNLNENWSVNIIQHFTVILGQISKILLNH